MKGFLFFNAGEKRRYVDYMAAAFAGLICSTCCLRVKQLQDTNEAKTAKFKKLLSMKFGPKANHMLELVSFCSFGIRWHDS